MARAITIRELQKLSATSIAQLSGAIPVQSNGRTVALLVPLRPSSEEARVRFHRALQQAQFQRSPEEQRAFDRKFGPRPRLTGAPLGQPSGKKTMERRLHLVGVPPDVYIATITLELRGAPAIS
jgi:hypothetical protein